jgi:hypothetical protein
MFLSVGLEHLFRTHPNVLTGEQAYSMINCEGRAEYGPKFQVIKVRAFLFFSYYAYISYLF